MPTSLWLIAVAVWLLWAAAARRLNTGPRGDVESGLVWRFLRLYGRLMHRVRYEGLENLPDSTAPGPLLVVSNHTAGVDPVLVQAACPFFIRWMMAKDMKLDALGWLWAWTEIITVDRDGREVVAAREALRHLQNGGVIGIFPEGTLERPPRSVMPFLPGVGLIVKRAGVRVLPVIIEGTPQVDPAWGSLWRRSRSVVAFKPVIDYTGSGLKPHEIADDLRRRYVEWTGWPARDPPKELFPGGKGK
ncbi:MAG: 1-acyl-sn-glycerol-3-phosphate acyltransferase [Leptolyngbya sp. PLA2]|nr:1-acyl-sn-glycerol-3-phosphate acyltransferase [Leptolyngbya sp. PL-A2]MCQ3941451.1 hypothetical protein [cyanobacterium CYA1]MCZ7633014.1 1-acyl-sn-glycerol-3-phosphate acyltransferase [Phycisphaerales bacterium]MDL1904563.1 1-acyl-sn-glycerol-3-phosphate acyltransferase [Synechococcales cyanobacterium CNB]